MEEKQWYKMLIKPCKNRGLDITFQDGILLIDGQKRDTLNEYCELLEKYKRIDI
jgi:hypothetical protein